MTTPTSNIYYLVAAELYEKAGRTPDAIAMLDKAVAARPSDDALISALAQLYRRTGRSRARQKTFWPAG